jgi:hypothetical protein
MSNETPARVWHVDPDALQGWVDGVAGPLVSVSVEQHVQHCAHCQAAVTELLPATLRSSWDDVLTAVEVPRPGWVHRFLLRLGLNQSDSLIVASGPTLRVPWILGTIGVLFFVLVATVYADVNAPGLFLLVAPMIPLAGVAVAYGPAADPSYEAVLTSPYPMVRLALLRTVSVLATSVPLVIGAGLLLPTSTLVAVAWLLPAAGFIAVVLTASNWVEPSYAAVAVGASWFTAVVWAVRDGDPTAVLAPAALAIYLAMLGVAVLTMLHRLLGATPSWRLR